jgi:hypothetical protein
MLINGQDGSRTRPLLSRRVTPRVMIFLITSIKVMIKNQINCLIQFYVAKVNQFLCNTPIFVRK